MAVPNACLTLCRCLFRTRSHHEFMRLRDRGTKMVDTDFDILQILKQLRANAVRMKCLMDIHQRSMSMYMSKKEIDPEAPSTSEEDSDAPKPEPDFSFIDEILGNRLQLYNSKLLKSYYSVKGLGVPEYLKI